MPRKSRAIIPSPSSAPPKRALSPSKPTPTRQSKRVKSSPISKTTPKKSQFFSKDTTNSESESATANEESGYEDEDASLVSSPPESEVEEDDVEEESSESDEKTVARQRKRASGVAVRGVKAGKQVKGQELWRPGVKADLAPGEQVFIKLPKARGDGGVKYADNRIHPNTMSFLKDLKKNNDREWLKVHDADYRQSKSDFDSFVERLTEKIVEKDETVPELPSKDLTFRIYRDIRFSSDPTPYKTYFSAAWSRTGRKGPYAGYYVQIQPGGSFVGGGLWHPEAAPLALLRRAVDQESDAFKNVLLEDRVRKEFLGGVAKDKKKVVKAFVGMNGENMLKTKPKGYEADNPNIDLLRLRNYTMGRKLKDDEILGAQGLSNIMNLMETLVPFVKSPLIFPLEVDGVTDCAVAQITHLNSIVMPDEVDDSDDDDDDDGGSAMGGD